MMQDDERSSEGYVLLARIPLSANMR